MNSKTVRFIVIIEVLVCFVPLAGMLLMGLLFAPFVVLDMLKGRPGNWGLFVVLGCGIAGLIALVQVLKWLFRRPTDVLGRWWTLALMLLGLYPVIHLSAAAVGDYVAERRGLWYVIVTAAPILVTAHLAYLAREYLFTSTQSEVNP